MQEDHDYEDGVPSLCSYPSLYLYEVESDEILFQFSQPQHHVATEDMNLGNATMLTSSLATDATTILMPPSPSIHPVLIAVNNHISPLTTATLPQLLDSAYDRYGFKKVSLNKSLSLEDYNDWISEYTPYLKHRLEKWHDHMKGSGLQITDNNIPSSFPPRSGRTKKMIRRGIPAEWRGNAWFFYAGGHDKLHKFPNLYSELVSQTEKSKIKDSEVIERDLNRTFPDNYYFNASLLLPDHESPCETSMISSLRRVLVAFAHHQPHIGYCQSLNFLAGLLLIFMSEERAFWLLVILTEQIIPKVHSADLEGVHTDQGVLMLCIKEYIPQLWLVLGKTFEGDSLSEDKILTRLPPVTLVTSSWFMSLFVGNLPIESVLRVWDILWYEGSKTIFRISLTIAKKCFDGPEFQAARILLGHESEQIEIFQLMQQFPRTLLDPNDLIALCFKKIGGYRFGSLSQLEINNCREFVAHQREKINSKRAVDVKAGLTESERRALSLLDQNDQNVHDVYGFNRSIMRSATWNKIVADKMKRKFSRKSES